MISRHIKNQKILSIVREKFVVRLYEDAISALEAVVIWASNRVNE
jgi:hypothetical protein